MKLNLLQAHALAIAVRKERRLARRHDCSDIETIRNWATGKERPPAEDD